MVNFLNSHKKAKVLVFVSNAAQAEYFALIVQPLLESKQVNIFLLDGNFQKNPKKKH